VQQVDPFVAPVDAALRVVAFLVAAGLIGIVVAYAWVLFADWWAGRASLDLDLLLLVLFFIALPLFPLIRRLLLTTVRGFDRGPDAAEIESRAFLEAVERHDRLLEAQRLATEKADGAVDAERPRQGGPG